MEDLTHDGISTIIHNVNLTYPILIRQTLNFAPTHCGLCTLFIDRISLKLLRVFGVCNFYNLILTSRFINIVLVT